MTASSQGGNIGSRLSASHKAGASAISRSSLPELHTFSSDSHIASHNSLPPASTFLHAGSAVTHHPISTSHRLLEKCLQQVSDGDANVSDHGPSYAYGDAFADSLAAAPSLKPTGHSSSLVDSTDRGDIYTSPWGINTADGTQHRCHHGAYEICMSRWPAHHLHGTSPSYNDIYHVSNMPMDHVPVRAKLSHAENYMFSQYEAFNTSGDSPRAEQLSTTSVPTEVPRSDSTTPFSNIFSAISRGPNPKCVDCLKGFIPKEGVTGEGRCSRHYKKWQAADARTRVTIYKYDEEVQDFDGVIAWLYQDYDGLSRPDGDDFEECQRRKSEWVKSFIDAVNAKYPPEPENDMLQNHEVQQKIRLIKAQETLNQKPYLGSGETWFTNENVNRRLVLLVQTIINLHKGGERPYPRGGDNSGYGNGRPDANLTCSQRLQLVEDTLRIDKGVVVDVIEGRGVCAFAENPIAYRKRKMSNKSTNDTKTELIKVGKELKGLGKQATKSKNRHSSSDVAQTHTELAESAEEAGEAEYMESKTARSTVHKRRERAKTSAQRQAKRSKTTTRDLKDTAHEAPTSTLAAVMMIPAVTVPASQTMPRAGLPPAVEGAVWYEEGVMPPQTEQRHQLNSLDSHRTAADSYEKLRQSLVEFNDSHTWPDR